MLRFQGIPSRYSPAEKGRLVVRRMNMDNLILIGVVRKVRGIKGDLKVESMSDFPERFSELREVLVRKPNSTETVKVELDRSEFVNNYAVIRLKGVDSYDGAAAYLGAELLVPETERVVPPEGTYFVDSLIGMNLKNADGRKIGVVADLLSNRKQSILTVRMDDGTEFDLPFVSAFVKKVDIEAGEMTVELIDGLIGERKPESRRTSGEN
jgi:16S rRNA processing protein RimM